MELSSYFLEFPHDAPSQSDWLFNTQSIVQQNYHS